MPATSLEEKLKGLPQGPGCYLFRDERDGVLYVGKAKSLRARVKSYFQSSSSDTRAFIPVLLASIADLETIVTRTEKEAAILENNLIKEHQPRFNVKLRDDKEYLNIKLDPTHDWPRLTLVRRPDDAKARYFGPYHSATAARRTLHLVEKHFQLRTCSDRELKQRVRPCLQYQIKRCLAPCVLDVDREEYEHQVRAVQLFLDGRHPELTRELGARMKESSEKMEFELAARYRDQLEAVRSVAEEQRVVAATETDQDVLGMYRQGDLAELSVMYVRQGRVSEVATFSHRRVDLPDDELVAAFLREHYSNGGAGESHIPDEILLPVLPEGAAGVAEWLSERRQQATEARRRKQCQLFAPVRGARRKLLNLASENAKHAFEEKRRAADDIHERLEKVRQKLRLSVLPRRIECSDLSHLGGKDTVGSVVSFFDGAPDKKRYRIYKVHSAEPGDDYAAMFEVLGRRFQRGAVASQQQNDKEKWELPDLFVVDGGPGQLSVALAAAHDLGLFDLSIVALAKEKERPLSEKVVDRVYLPGQKNPISLRANSAELFILAHARDEAHRFANRGRKQVGKKRRFQSELSQVPGIGPKTQRALLKTLGSLEKVKQASDESLLSVPGVKKSQVEALRKYWGG